jgi:signal transduction histidine kinase
MADALSYKRRILLVDLGSTAAEALVVVSLAAILVPFGSRQTAAMAHVAIPCVVATLLLWEIILALCLLPIHRAVVARRRGEILDRSTAEAAYAAMTRAPRRVLLLRSGLAMAAALVIGLTLWWQTGFARGALATLTSVVALASYAVGLVRSTAVAATLRAIRPALLPGVAPLRLLADDYRRRLSEVSFGLGILALGLLGLFAALFLPIQLDVARVLVAWLLPVTAAGALLWYFLLVWLSAPIEAYLETAARSRPGERPAIDDPRATAAYRAAQALPVRLAVAKVGAWALAAVALGLLARVSVALPLDEAFLLLGAAVLVSVGAAIYESLWHRASLRGLLSLIASSHRLPVSELRLRRGLRGKMLLAFGGLVAFACGLSLLWGFAQYKSLAGRFITDEAELRLEWIKSEVETRAAGIPAATANAATATAATDPTTRMIDAVLAEAAQGSTRGATFYYLPHGHAETPAVFSKEPDAPAAPALVTQALAGGGSGGLEVPALHVAGAYEELVLAGRDVGAVAVLYPVHLGTGAERPLRDLLLFFVALATVCGGIVWVLVKDVVEPIRTLGDRAADLAKGELGRAMYTGGDADEIGLLAFTLEEMRRSLRERLRSTEELTLDLEHEVERRTADLARKNRELSEALEKLKRAQAELVRAEKMASIGQLVAGIAHEINNPVNAIVNTAAPLEAVLEELLSRAGGAPGGGAPSLKSFADDARDMLRVIQRGGKRTKDIVQALHNYSRADDDRVQDVDLHRGLDDSLDLLRHRLKGISIEKEYGLQGRVRGHAGQLHQVFMNILTNAAQALEGQSDARIRIATAVEDGHVVVRVSDNGPGIPEDVLPRIFDPFFTTKDVGQGSGLGLSIVHGIVERHGGTIDVETAPGEGTTFIVSLPQGGVASA